MKRKAHAKLNLGLNVIRKREDGYHDLRMIMVPVDLFDTVEIVESSQLTIQSDKYYLPNDDKNTVYKAVQVMHEMYQTPTNFQIKLVKNIPTQAGMAGGSADAASTLIGINRMYRLNLSLEELCDRGLKLGADVPYCIQGGTMHATGIGEHLKRIAPMPECFVVVAKPKASASTKVVYQKFDQLEQVTHPNMTNLLQQIEKKDLKEIATEMGNVLEQVTIPMIPEIAVIKDVLLKHGALNAMMSGSGPTVFGLFTELIYAENAVLELSEKKEIQKVCITRFWNK